MILVLLATYLLRFDLAAHAGFLIFVKEQVHVVLWGRQKTQVDFAYTRNIELLRMDRLVIYDLRS